VDAGQVFTWVNVAALDRGNRAAKLSAARDGVAWFIDHAPSTFQLVIATRSEPALPLAALRAHGALLELRAEELGFTRAEADALLNDRLELGLEPDSVDGLVERTTAPGTRRSLYRQIQQGLNAGGPFIPLIQPTQVFAATSDLAGAVFSGAYDVDVTHVSPR
jgi:hypothetical protein